MLNSVCEFCTFFFFSSRRRHTRCSRDWSSDVCSSISLSSRCAQKGHFTRHDLLVDGQLRPALLSYAPVRATSPTTVLPESRTAHPRDCKRRSQSAREQPRRRSPAPFLPQISS